ncbi:hypothetical protein WOLCODRAFT_163960 [Wolfiporia cocos MD-104 SS10]|uniref:Glucose receptor Git3 N-terminal domain-containing protein n=1 Tax=Wolfiporia cocos (strain MD-104) TaxID=742152 RepID=A0A2H3JKF6_WOLCO|nr:hypothetical protein WOLCODRAFT_163960 [Wolfiporia cocos MD-104 SS10]
MFKRFPPSHAGPVRHTYQPGEASALSAVLVFAVITILAVGFVLFRVSWWSMHAMLARRGMVRNVVRKERSFFQTQLGAYTISLLLGNFMMSIAFIINAHWIRKNGVEPGFLCTAQGVFSEIGDTAGGYFTAAIAIHAFSSLICHHRLPAWFCGFAVACGWVISVAIGLFPLAISNVHSGPIYGFDGLSCGISLSYNSAQVMLRLIPVFLAILVSMIFYGLVFLILRGTLSTAPCRPQSSFDQGARRSIAACSLSVEYQRFIYIVAKSMLWYPVAFGILLVPSISVDLMRATGQNTSFGMHIFADALSAMLGLANAVILLNTLRILAPYLATFRSLAENADSESFDARSSSPALPIEYADDTVDNKIRRPESRELEVVIETAPDGASTHSRMQQLTPSYLYPRDPPPVQADRVERRPSESSADGTVFVQQPIAPASMLDALVAAPEPVHTSPSPPPSQSPSPDALPPSVSLPVPRRIRRSPAVSQSLDSESRSSVITQSVSAPSIPSMILIGSAFSDFPVPPLPVQHLPPPPRKLRSPASASSLGGADERRLQAPRPLGPSKSAPGSRAASIASSAPATCYPGLPAHPRVFLQLLAEPDSPIEYRLSPDASRSMRASTLTGGGASTLTGGGGSPVARGYLDTLSTQPPSVDAQGPKDSVVYRWPSLSAVRASYTYTVGGSPPRPLPPRVPSGQFDDAIAGGASGSINYF